MLLWYQGSLLFLNLKTLIVELKNAFYPLFIPYFWKRQFPGSGMLFYSSCLRLCLIILILFLFRKYALPLFRPFYKL